MGKKLLKEEKQTSEKDENGHPVLFWGGMMICGEGGRPTEGILVYNMKPVQDP